MEVKKFSEYNDEEKREILNHLWHYYWKELYSLDELERYNNIISINSDKLFDLAMATYIGKNNYQQVVLATIRTNSLNLLLGKLPNFEEGTVLKSEYEKACLIFLEEVVRTYNNPEPDIPMSEEEIISQCVRLVKSRENSKNKKRFN